MGIGPLSKTSPRTSPAVDLDALRIGAAVEHIKAHGNLDGFPAGRGERLALVSTAARQGLLAWDRSRGKYELTGRGRRHVPWWSWVAFSSPSIPPARPIWGRCANRALISRAAPRCRRAHRRRKECS